MFHLFFEIRVECRHGLFYGSSSKAYHLYKDNEINKNGLHLPFLCNWLSWLVSTRKIAGTVDFQTLKLPEDCIPLYCELKKSIHGDKDHSLDELHHDRQDFRFYLAKEFIDSIDRPALIDFDKVADFNNLSMYKIEWNAIHEVRNNVFVSFGS